MNTVILKWNPGFSSYPMLAFFDDLNALNQDKNSDFNWSVWDWRKIKDGDNFYWLKLGYGATGIVANGTIISNPYSGEDWSGKGRETYYVDFLPNIMINPDTLPILTTQALDEVLPDFDWHKGHSGLVLDERQAAILNETWDKFTQQNLSLFIERKNRCRNFNDQIFLNIAR